MAKGFAGFLGLQKIPAKDVYQDYHKHGNSQKFEAAHEQELAMHREAKKDFRRSEPQEIAQYQKPFRRI